MKKAVQGLGLILALSPLAQAMADSNFYVGARVGAAALQNNCSVGTTCENKDVAGGLITGYDFGKVFFLDGLSIEGTYDFLGNYEYHHSNLKGKYNIYSATLAPKFDWAMTDRTDLYGKIGGAWWRNDNAEKKYSEASLMGAVGIDHRASDMINLRLEYQYIKDINTTIFHDAAEEVLANSHMLTAGITFHFGRDPIAPIVEEAPVIEEVPVIEEEIVYEEITPVIETITIPAEETHVNFGFDETQLTEDQKANLEPMVQRLNEYQDSTATITGYTDSTGPAEINLTISQERAKSVADYFMQNGISMDRLDVQALGDSDPVATNNTAEGRKENRRVEVQSPEFTVTQGE